LKKPPAVAALIGAALVFALMALATKVASARLPGPQVAFIRFLIGIVACGIARIRVPMHARNKVGLLLRGAYGGAAVLFYFMAIAHLPVGIATLLNYTAPVFTAIYAAIFLREAITRGTLVALAMTSVGVALVIVGTAPAGSLALGPWPPVGLLSVIGQLLMTHALRYVRAAVGGIIAQLTPVTSMALGWMMFRDRIAGLALAGAALTLAGVSVGAYLASGREADPVDE